MNFKDYMKCIENKIEKMNEEELRKWILNYVRQVPVSKRERVLSSFSLENCNHYHKEINKI